MTRRVLPFTGLTAYMILVLGNGKDMTATVMAFWSSGHDALDDRNYLERTLLFLYNYKTRFFTQWSHNFLEHNSDELCESSFFYPSHSCLCSYNSASSVTIVFVTSSYLLVCDQTPPFLPLLSKYLHALFPFPILQRQPLTFGQQYSTVLALLLVATAFFLRRVNYILSMVSLTICSDSVSQAFWVMVDVISVSGTVRV